MSRIAGCFTPKYRKHKASEQAVVTIGGRHHYLGHWRSKASRIEYDRLIGEWLAAGRPPSGLAPSNDRIAAEWLLRYWRFAKQHYRKHGHPTGTLNNTRYAA